MALPTSGPISLADIQAEFGGTNPISLSEYYKGGSFVLPTDTAPNVPASGAISLSMFYGASKAPSILMPYFVSVNTPQSSTSGYYVNAPSSYADGDLLVLLVNTANQAVSAPADGTWTQFPSSPQGTGTAGNAGATRITAFYKVVSGVISPTSILIIDSGNYQATSLLVIRRQNESTPVDATAGGVKSSSTGTTFTLPAVTTTAINDLILLVVGQDRDLDSTTNLSGWTNANLANITERVDFTVSTASGGGIGVATGEEASIGNIGTTTVTSAAATTAAFLTLAIAGSSTYNNTTRCLGPTGRVSSLGVNEASTASITLNTDGSITASSSPSGSGYTELIANTWLNNVSTGAGASYWVRPTITTTTGNSISGPSGSWIQMNTARTWSISSSTVVTQSSGAIKLEWSTSSSGTPIVATSGVNLLAVTSLV